MKSILIIGMGEFGKHLAYKLDALGNDVCLIDSKEDIINVLSQDFQNVYTGDCMNGTVLNDVGVGNFDICVVAIGQNFQASLEITSNLKERGAKYIISKAASDIQSKFLKMAGADETIYPEKDIADKVAMTCNANNMFDYIQVSDEYGIFEVKALPEWVNESLKSLNIRNKYNINIIAISSNGSVSMPDANYVFKSDDHVYIIGTHKDVNKLSKKTK